MTYLDAALTYAAYGWRVFPCVPNAKHPCTPNGHLEATTDPATITAWWSIWPDANPAVHLAASGLVAIDADLYKPDCEWPGYEATTYTQQTPRGGLHMVFTAPAGAEYPGALCRGVEIKYHGYILLAPSVVDGQPYTVTNNIAPAPAPDWIPTRQPGTSNPELTAASIDDIRSALATIPNDAPDWDWWSRVAGAIYNASGGSDEAWHAFDAWSRQCPAYDPGETQAKWRQVARSPYRDVGMGTLFHLATQADPSWQRPSRVAAVFGDGAPVQPVAVPSGTPAPGGTMRYLTVDAQAEHFKGCVYVASHHRVLMPNGELLKPEVFKVRRGGFEFQMSYDHGKPTKNAFEAFTENRAADFPQADKMCFRPEDPPGAIIRSGMHTLVNTYLPANVHKTYGDVTRWTEHLARLFPNDTDRAIICSYLAALVQYPGVKFRWAPVIQGVEGNGKGVILAAAEYAVGEHYTHKPNAKELGDSGAKFTGWLDRKLLILIEEIYVSDRRDILDALKPLITDDRVEIQHKGVDQVTGENRANFILTSNHKDAIIKTSNDRRYAIFYTAQQSRADLERDGMSGNYMPDMWDWLRKSGGLADIAGWLSRYAIPDELNPATRAHRAPDTTSTADAIAESRGMVEQEIMQAVEEGRPGFCGGWISSVALGRLLSDLKRTVPPRKRRAIIESLGYVAHPALADGQSPTPIVQEDMKRPRLYVKDGSIPFHNLHNSKDAFENYMNAQGYYINYSKL